MVVSVLDGLAGVARCEGLGRALTVDVVLGATDDREMRGLMDQSSTLSRSTSAVVVGEKQRKGNITLESVPVVVVCQKTPQR